jgi:hypothetical protein
MPVADRLIADLDPDYCSSIPASLDKRYPPDARRT